MSDTYKRLRSFLNPSIRGKFTEALLHALAKGDAQNDANVLALKDSLFIATASETFLDRLLSGIGIIRPSGVGIDDDQLRRLAVSVTSKKLVQNIFLEILEQFYGEDAVKSNIISSKEEPYALADGMDLLIQQDGKPPLRVEIKAEDFQNIAAAKAIEVATIITRAAALSGYTLYATDYLDAQTGKVYVQVYTGTRGPRGTIAIVGGSAQNVLLFPEVRLTSQMPGTQFTTSIEGDSVRYTWTGGPNPNLQFVEVGDYVNIKSPPFPPEHAGSYTITKVVQDVVGTTYFEVKNPIAQSMGTFSLAAADDVMFYRPKRNTVNDLVRVATIYEVHPYELVIYLPVTTKIVKRTLKGAWHIHKDATDHTYLGSYLYDPKTGFTISGISAKSAQTVNAGSNGEILTINNPTQPFKDEIGYLIFNYGTQLQEGPIRYLGTPSSNTLRIDPAYVFKNTHPVGSDIMYLHDTRPAKPNLLGDDYPTYITGTIKGRVYAEKLSKELSAAGIFINIVIVYPSGVGLNSVEDVYAPDIT